MFTTEQFPAADSKTQITVSLWHFCHKYIAKPVDSVFRVRVFPHFSEKRNYLVLAIQSVVWYTLSVGEDWKVFTSPLRGSADIYHCSPSLR